MATKKKTTGKAKAAKTTKKSAKPKAAKKAVKKAAPKKVAAKTTKKTTAKAAAGKKISYTTSNIMSGLSTKQVWDALMNPSVIEKLFADKQIGKFGPDLKPVTWHWDAWGDMTFTPTKYVEGSEVEFKGDSGKLTIRFEVVDKDGKTIFRIHENGHAANDLKSVFMYLEGWTEFHCALKFYLKTGTALKVE